MADNIHKLQDKLQQLQSEVEDIERIVIDIEKLQNYVEQFKNSQDYQELESIVRSEVGKTLLDNKKLLQNALVSVIVALRNDPDRYLLIDRMELLLLLRLQ